LRLLVIEDEDRLSGILKAKFGDVGFTVDIAVSAADAAAALELINYDAAVLDLGLPDGDGLAVLKAARRIGSKHPASTVAGSDQAAAAWGWDIFQCQGSSSCNLAAG
jgi:DNA-binding response OmpR family regulator